VTSHVWQDIRALRAAPTGLAQSDKGRRAVFAAALGQAEELAVAAAAVSYAARPLPMFYALSQAGRAISAAHTQDRYEISGHGLDFTQRGKALEKTLFGIVAPPEARSEKTCKHCGEVTSPAGNPPRQAFQVVTEATGSPQLAGPAELGALWAANPDLRAVGTPEGMGEWLRSVDGIVEVRPNPNLAISREDDTVFMVGLPAGSGREVSEALKAYPSLAGAVPLASGPHGLFRAGPDDVVFEMVGDDGESRIVVSKPGRTGYLTPGERRAHIESMFSIVEVNERLPLKPTPSLVGFAQPPVGSGLSPSPLMLWWALLLGMSSLARYYPAAWTEAINLDGSRLAVPLQQVLDVAATRVPARILAALRG
jgi:hypothetical protein